MAVLKRRCQDVRPATQAEKSFLGAPRALSRFGLLVGYQFPVDDVGDASFQRSEGFLLGFAFGLFLVVVDAAGGVVADLGDGGHVDGMVQHPVASHRQPVFGLTT